MIIHLLMRTPKDRRRYFFFFFFFHLLFLETLLLALFGNCEELLYLRRWWLIPCRRLPTTTAHLPGFLFRRRWGFHFCFCVSAMLTAGWSCLPAAKFRQMILSEFQHFEEKFTTTIPLYIPHSYMLYTYIYRRLSRFIYQFQINEETL